MMVLQSAVKRVDLLVACLEPWKVGKLVAWRVE